MDKVARAQLEAELEALRGEVRQLLVEQALLNEDAPGPEGNRHAFITSQLRVLRNTETRLSRPLRPAG
jgi:hypothetical protein